MKNFTIKNSPVFWMGLLVVCLVLVCLPRFNRREIDLVIFKSGTESSYQGPSDADQYVLCVRFFREEGVGDQLRPPFICRPLVPLLASKLPFRPMTSINVLNILALLIALFFLYAILYSLKLEFRLRILGCALFVFSFPTFYYGTIGYIDPVLICFIMAGTYCVLADKPAFLAFVACLGVLVKETTIVLLPVYFISIVFSGRPRGKQFAFLCIIALGYIAVSYLIRVLAPVKVRVWRPDCQTLLANVTRLRSWTSFLLSFGIPGFLSLVLLFSGGRKIPRDTLVKLAPFITGALMAIALFGFSMVSAFSDGRFVWVSYPFTIPIAMGLVGGTLKPLKPLKSLKSLKS